MEKEYVVVMWPEVQELMVMPEFREHSYLINDDKGLDDFGSSAYFVEKSWLYIVLSSTERLINSFKK